MYSIYVIIDLSNNFKLAHFPSFPLSNSFHFFPFLRHWVFLSSFYFLFLSFFLYFFFLVHGLSFVQPPLVLHGARIILCVLYPFLETCSRVNLQKETYKSPKPTGKSKEACRCKCCCIELKSKKKFAGFFEHVEAVVADVRSTTSTEKNSTEND